MLVAMVTAPGRPAWAMIAASRSWYLAFSTWWATPRFSSSLAQVLRVLDGDGADQHGPLLFVHLGDLVDHRAILGRLGLVDQVGAVVADHRPVGRDNVTTSRL